MPDSGLRSTIVRHAAGDRWPDFTLSGETDLRCGVPGRYRGRDLVEGLAAQAEIYRLSHAAIATLSTPTMGCSHHERRNRDRYIPLRLITELSLQTASRWQTFTGEGTSSPKLMSTPVTVIVGGGIQPSDWRRRCTRSPEHQIGPPPEAYSRRTPAISRIGYVSWHPADHLQRGGRPSKATRWSPAGGHP